LCWQDLIGRRTLSPITVETPTTIPAEFRDRGPDLDGVALVTADHGNADEMFMRDKATGEQRPKTSHTLNPVPLLNHDPRPVGEPRFVLSDLVSDPGLANIAATVLELLGYEAPED
jgi:bisphosphoglycerate-independent phosphoglycerate mutase (AlkP superfamily)